MLLFTDLKYSKGNNNNIHIMYTKLGWKVQQKELFHVWAISCNRCYSDLILRIELFIWPSPV